MTKCSQCGTTCRHVKCGELKDSIYNVVVERVEYWECPACHNRLLPHETLIKLEKAEKALKQTTKHSTGKNMSTKFIIYLNLMMFSIIPAILILVHTAWFIYQGGLPDSVVLNLSTKRAFCIAAASVLATIINSHIALSFLYEKAKKENEDISKCILDKIHTF